MAVATKYSRQREALIQNLKARTDHPTAEMLHQDLRKEFPSISLGTVYRNLAAFEKNGDIIRISNGSGTDHYDGCTTPHYHFSCNNCGSVTDVHIPMDFGINKQVESDTGGLVSTQSTIFYGICKNCVKSA